MAPRLMPRHLRALSLGDLIRMGQELYAEAPLLHLFDKGRARRLAALIMAKTPEINGALFLAPAYGCSAKAVSARIKRIEPPVLADLRRTQEAEGVDLTRTDSRIWRRLAA